ncbi:MAG: response regulator transcription factor [Anaerolineales bacterium]|jgi:DNA-binding NarL/FixJ family response regulator
MKTVLVVDDHVLFRSGLRYIVEKWDDFSIIGEASDGMEALDLARQLCPDLVLMDVAMPGMDGIEAVRRIKTDLPGAHVIMLTVSESEDDLFRALKNGASGYLLKNVKPKTLRSMLNGVLDGEAPLSSRMAAKIVKEFSQGKDDVKSRIPELGSLTPRETEVLELVAAGLSNSEVANRLVISENTVKKYLHNILEKLQLNNRVEAAVYAVRKGLVRD